MCVCVLCVSARSSGLQEKIVFSECVNLVFIHAKKKSKKVRKWENVLR